MSSPSLQRSGELDLILESMGQIEGRLHQMAELLLWRGIQRQVLAERSILLSRDGVCLEQIEGDPAVGDVVELEIHLPFVPFAHRFRSTAIVEHSERKHGQPLLFARFDAIDDADRESLERYLFLLEKKRHAAQIARDDVTLERVGSWHPERNSSGSGMRSPGLSDEAAREPIVDEQWQGPTGSRQTRQRPDQSVHAQPQSVHAQPQNVNALQSVKAQPHVQPLKTKATSFDDVLAEVFESMHGLYELATTDECLTFAVDIMRKSVHCEAVVGLKAEALGTPASAVLVVTSQGKQVTKARGRRFALRGSLVDIALTEGISVSVSNAEQDRRLCADVDCLLGAETKSYLCVPIAHEGRSFGALMLLNRLLPGSWRQGELNIATYVASRVGEYIDESLPTPDVEHAAA